MEFSEYIQSSLSVETIHRELESGYPYYKDLTPVLKARFVHRTSIFIQQKKFVARQDLKMTDTIRVIVSACAIQVTFGLDSFTLDTFEYVVIYPDIYESPITKKMHKGETNLNGFICLSWKDIVAGIANPNDNYNLGLHEWTHALRFNSINFEETDYFFDNYINKWVSNSMHEFNKLKNGNQSIFRRYGATNIHEFLSVCTEHFFESPDEFKSSAPEFFDQMCILFNQMPVKNGSAKINVRYALLFESLRQPDDQPPVLILEASFLRTLANFGVGLLFVIVPMIFLLAAQNTTATMIALFIFLGAVIKMNSMYFTIKFYESGIYIQKGFAPSFATKLYVNYHALTKMEIYNGNFDSYSTSTVFQLNYYDGNHFLKKSAYCSAIDVPQQKIFDLLMEKQVAILWPN